jgi:regulator of protease activity HflC (stomatin/prohibitin superfamily)
MDDETRFPVGRAIGGAIAIVALLWLCGVGIGACKSLGSTGPGEVAVLINGGWFDSKDQRDVEPPSSGYKVPGLYTQWRKYIHESQQRFYTIRPGDSGADEAEAEVVVPTRDGVQVSIEGTTNFHTTFSGEDDDPNLLAFDTRFGNRTYAGDKYVWDDDGGWEAFLAAQFRPVLVSTFREEIGGLDCAELVSSCALIQQGAQQTGQIDIEAVQEAGDKAEASFEEVASAVEAKLETRMEAALGGQFLTGWEVQIERVVLPEEVQGAIDTAQSAFAAVSEQRARAEAAKFEAKRIAERAKALSTPGAAALEIAALYAEACGSGGSTCVVDATGGIGLNLPK